MKVMTRSQAETKRQQASEFLRRIGHDDDARRFEAMDTAEYAEHKGAELRENPTRRNRAMPRSRSKSDIQAELDSANEYIEELESKLDSIASITAGDDEEDDETDSEEDDLD